MNKSSIFWSLGVIAFVFLLSGCAGANLSKADQAKDKMQYKVAGDLYTLYGPKVKGPNAKEEQKRAREEAAYCYRMANDYEKAIKAYEKVLKKDEKNTEALYQLASLKMKVAGGNDCDPEAMREAREYIKKYLEEVPNDERGLKKLAAMDSAENWRKEAPNSRYKVTNFKIVNTKGMDYSPMIASKKDDVLYYSTDREGPVSKKKVYGYTGNGYSDMWYVQGKKTKGNKKTAATKTWEKPVIALGSINTKFNDGSCAFDRKYSTIYYTQCNGADGKSTSCKLFQAKLDGTQWSGEQMLSFCINDTFDYGHPSLSEDGKTLYFSSNRDGGEGGYDIWCAVYNQRAKDWGEPFNLGPAVNTAKDEMFPYWNTHDQSLYFSSNGHLGMGALDIFKVEGGGTEWTVPENMRAPLNSGGDDYGMTFDNNNPDHGFFTSNRCGGKGNFDIYEFNISPLVIEIEGYVYECLPKMMSDAKNANLSKPLVNSTITITNDKDSTKIVVKTDDKGYYGLIRLKEKTNYEINCDNRELYYFDAPPVQRTTKGIKISTKLRQDFCLNSQIIIRTVPIFYDLDKADIRPDAAQVLNDSILPILMKYPKLRMELGSHTDCRSSYDYNIDLSQRRADSAVAWLVRKGVNPRRLLAKGYGESQLVNDCACEGPKKSNCSESEHQRNRRTTIKTLDVNFDPNMKDESDPNNDNVNVKTTIVKLTKKDPNYVVLAAGNGNENPMPSVVTPTGADITISMAELKMLKTKNLIKPADLTGMTFADIDGGRIKPGATVKLATLRFGPKDRAYTMNDVVVKIGSGPAPFTFGMDALKAQNGTFNVEESEITFKHVNKAALKDGPVDANSTKGNTPANESNGSPKPADTLSLADHQRVAIVSDNGKDLIPTMVNDKENINWELDQKGRKILIDETTVKQLLDNDVITKKDFDTEGESIRLKDGTKLPSNTLILAKIQIGDVTMENVKVVVDGKIETPVIGMGNTAVKKLNPVVKGKTFYMKPKEKRSRPGKDE